MRAGSKLKSSWQTALYDPQLMFRAFRFLENQVTSNLNYVHVGMCFIYRGAVSGSRGLMSLDMLPVSESFTPKRFLNDAFVNLSP